MTLGELVRKAREDKGWDQTQLANAAGYSQAAISDIEAGRTTAPRSWRKLAEALGIGEEQFRKYMVEAGRPLARINPSMDGRIITDFAVTKDGITTLYEMKNGRVHESVLPNATITGPVDRPDPNSIPVHGRAKGGDDGKYEFNGDVIGWEPRPAKLRGISGVYAVYIDGESMYPRYKAGETVVAQPGRPIARGDDVIVQLAADEENEAPYGYVKEFVRWTPTKLVLSQFNPKQEIEFARDQVVSVHRIVHADR